MSLNNKITTAALTDQGRVRSHNEDAVAVNAETGLLVLADGMGGHNAGEVASAVALQVITQTVCDAFTDETLAADTLGRKATALLKRAVEHAQNEIYSLAQTQAQYEGMGTTIVAALLHANRVSIVHVGDSRLYLFRKGELRQITCDHSLAQELVRRGHLTREEADAQINNNAITRALGIESTVEVEITEQSSQVGDIILMCSDGLYNCLDDEAITRTLNSHASGDLASAAQWLVDSANAAGGDDNISVILARIDELPSFPMAWHHLFKNWIRGT